MNLSANYSKYQEEMRQYDGKSFTTFTYDKAHQQAAQSAKIHD